MNEVCATPGCIRQATTGEEDNEGWLVVLCNKHSRYTGIKGWWTKCKEAEEGDGWLELWARDLIGTYGSPIYYYASAGITPSAWRLSVEVTHELSLDPRSDRPDRRAVMFGLGPLSLVITRERSISQRRAAVVKIKVTGDDSAA